MKYQKEFDFIKQNYNITQSDEALLFEIELFMKNIEDKYDYDYSKHIYALADVVMNHNNIGEDGLTPYARNILGEPKVPTLRVLDSVKYGF